MTTPETRSDSQENQKSHTEAIFTFLQVCKCNRSELFVLILTRVRIKHFYSAVKSL